MKRLAYFEFSPPPVPEMTYNVFSGTLNPTHFTSLLTAPYHTHGRREVTMATMHGNKHSVMEKMTEIPQIVSSNPN